MKKYIICGVCMVMTIMMAGCSGIDTNSSVNNNNTEITKQETNNSLDYESAEIFEKALNDGEKVNGKTVRFDVLEYKPDSAMGINCWSGEHLNFISESELDVSKGDIIIGCVTNEPSKTLGSWKIKYEVISIEKNSEVSQTEPQSETASETESFVDSTEVSTESTNNSNGKIKMPHSSDYYLGTEWTYESLSEHLTGLGFTNIIGVECSPNEDNYKKKITALEISYHFGKEDPWNEGDEFEPDRAIRIYYISPELMTPENSEDLQTILSSSSISYTSFCKSYDERYVEFEAVVVEHLTYDGGTSHIIDVKGPNQEGLLIRIGDRTWGNDIDLSVQPGDSVIVSGQISNRWAEYFKQVYVETITLKKK